MAVTLMAMGVVALAWVDSSAASAKAAPSTQPNTTPSATTQPVDKTADEAKTPEQLREELEQTTQALLKAQEAAAATDRELRDQFVKLREGHEAAATGEMDVFKAKIDKLRAAERDLDAKFRQQMDDLHKQHMAAMKDLRMAQRAQADALDARLAKLHAAREAAERRFAAQADARKRAEFERVKMLRNREQELKHALKAKTRGNDRKPERDNKAPEKKNPNAKDEDAAKELKKKLTKPVTVDFQKVELDLVMQFYRDVAGLDVWVDWTALAEHKITPKTTIGRKQKAEPWLASVKATIAGVDKGGKAKVEAVGHMVMVSTPKRLAMLKSRQDKLDMQVANHPKSKALSTNVQLHVDDAELAQMLKFFSNVTDVPFTGDWDALAKIGVEADVRISATHKYDARAGDALNLIAMSLDKAGRVVVDIQEDRVVLTVQMAARREVEINR